MLFQLVTLIKPLEIFSDFEILAVFNDMKQLFWECSPQIGEKLQVKVYYYFFIIVNGREFFLIDFDTKLNFVACSSNAHG